MQKASGLLPKPKERLIKEYVCDGCNMTVEQKEMEIPIGPRKGEWIIANYGCKCADIELSKQAIELKRDLQSKKMKQFFDENSLVNQSLQKATIENYKPTTGELKKAKQQIIDYINDFDGTKNLLLHGTYGTGKSHLSISVTKKLMEKGHKCLFLSLPKLLTKIRDTYNNENMTEDRLLEFIQRVDLLVLDDLGAEQQTEWSNTKLFEVMDSRAGKSTIYTTNLNSKELRKQMNERNFSRLMENTEIIIMNGPDFRRREF